MKRLLKERQTTSHRQAFTLIELLVVIAVIAVLMSILMPALARAREQGKRASCMSNTKQLLLAWNMYADDNDERIVFAMTNRDAEDDSRFGGSPTKPQKCWVYFEDTDATHEEKLEGLRQGAFYKYVKDERLFKCPTGIRGEVVTYTIPDALNGHRGHAVGPITTIKKRSDLKAPAKRIVFLDEGQLSPSSWTIYYDQPRWWDQITTRHGDGTNVGLADGHVEYYKWTDIRTVEVARHQDWQRSGRHSAMATQPGNVDLWKVQRGCWGKLGYPPQP